MLIDLSRWLFSSSGIDIDGEIDNGFVISAEKLYEIHIVLKSKLSTIKPINSTHTLLFLYWDHSEIKYAQFDSGNQNVLSSDFLIHCTIPGLNHDLVSLLNDHIDALLLLSTGDLNVD